MKGFKTDFFKSLLFVTVMTATTLFGICGCFRGEKKTITSVEAMTLTLQGMRGTSVYELAEADGVTELRLYREIYSDGNVTLKLEKSAVCDRASFIELMNDCGVIRWDGFHGKHPKNVLNGIMFNLTATVNGGETVEADGSANFPNGYNTFVRALGAILAEGDNK